MEKRKGTEHIPQLATVVSTMEEVMKEHFLRTYEMTGANLTNTARLLKIGRATAYRYLDKWRKSK